MASLRKELASSYLLTASRIGAWAAVSALLSRTGGAADFGAISTVRSLVTLLAYLSLGFSPVVLRKLVEASSPAFEPPQTSGNVLAYERSHPAGVSSASVIYGSARLVVVCLGVLMAILIVGLTPVRAGPPSSELGFLALMAGGMLARVVGDVPGMLLQSRGRLAIDNLITAAGEWAWPLMLVAWELFLRPPRSSLAESCAAAFLVSGLLAMISRLVLAGYLGEQTSKPRPSIRVAWGLLAAAGLLMVGHLADFLYAPTNQLLLAHRYGPLAVADYAPALQIDAAMLLLTGAVGAVMLPRAARALAEGQFAVVRRYYIIGTLACLSVLIAAAIPAAVLASPILHAWLGSDVSQLAITTVGLVLIHTVIGGSSGIGRAVILAAGRYRAYTITAIVAGVANVTGVATVLVCTDWGIRGVVAVTVITVTLRCAVWMPWYTLRLLRGLDSPRLDQGG